ncbi:cytochrome P450 71B34-like [Gossypium australe]|uniref:Cytochrome P450 71B34-like n=1 Tax=Gossypium australe TaxID=47621 RepID=A0A5B6WJ90_9ROSI|nr:cytochrome P450 71B34-like [Gossypium australe]
MDREFPFDLTIDHIKAILMNVFIAGTDTAAATVIWVMSALMKNPEFLKKTQAEVRDLVGKKGFVNEDYPKVWKNPERFLGNSIDYK